MPSEKFTDVYKKISAMGDKLKAAGKQGPSNDEQLQVCLFIFPFSLSLFLSHSLKSKLLAANKKQ